MARIGNVVKDGDSSCVAGVVDDEIAKPEDSLRNAGRNGDVLNLAEGNIARRAGNQARVDFDFGIRQRVPNHVSTQMVVSRNEE